MNVGLIGYGFMGASHLAAMQRMEGVAVKAVATRKRPAADSVPRGNIDLKSGPLPAEVEWYSDWQQMLLDPEIDTVDVCSPTHLHKQIVLRALELGKHVLCEKPMALTPSDCDVLLEAAAKTDRVFMVAQVLRFMYPYRYASRFVQSLGLDAIEACTFRRSTGAPPWSEWLSKVEYSGGAILDLMSHDLDLAMSIFGLPATVSAVKEGEADITDITDGTLFYAEGLQVNVVGGWYEPEAAFSQSFEIKGKDASLSFEKNQLLLNRSGVEEIVPMPEEDPYFDEIAYFVDCCRKGIAPDLCPPQASAQAVKAAALLKESRNQKGKKLPWQI